MEIDLLPLVEIQSGTFNVLIAPDGLAVEAVNNLLRSKGLLLLYVCGNYSRILSRIRLTGPEMDIRRAFTANQLISIIEEAHQTIVFVEYDPTLFNEFDGMDDCTASMIKEIRQDCTVIFYSNSLDRHIRGVSKKADRVFFFDSGPVRSSRKSFGGRSGVDGQSLLEVF